MTTVNDTTKKPKNLTYEDLDDGQVFRDEAGDLLMKCRYTCGDKPINYVLHLREGNFQLYVDVDKYPICELVDAEINIF